MKRTIGVVVGLLLLAASAAWFLSDLPSVVQEKLATGGFVEESRTVFASRSRGAAPIGSTESSGSSWETIKAGLDVANALIGLVGIYLAVRVLRQPRPS